MRKPVSWAWCPGRCGCGVPSVAYAYAYAYARTTFTHSGDLGGRGRAYGGAPVHLLLRRYDVRVRGRRLGLAQYEAWAAPYDAWAY